MTPSAQIREHLLLNCPCWDVGVYLVAVLYVLFSFRKIPRKNIDQFIVRHVVVETAVSTSRPRGIHG